MLNKDLIRFMRSLSREHQNPGSNIKALAAEWYLSGSDMKRPPFAPVLVEVTPTARAVAVSSKDFTSGADVVIALYSGLPHQNQGSFPVFCPCPVCILLFEQGFHYV